MDFFSYRTVPPNIGALSQIVYASGAIVTYEYSEQSITNSQLDLAKIPFGSPGGYSITEDDRYKTRVHAGMNYVVISNHDDSHDKIHLWAYYWVGRWMGGYLATYSTHEVEWDLTDDFFDTNNEIILSENFFVVNVNSGGGDNGDDEAIHIWYWDQLTQSWKNDYQGLVLSDVTGAEHYDVAVGRNYVAFLHKKSEGRFVRFTYFNDVWSKGADVNIGDGGDADYFLFGHRNYFILRNDDTDPQDQLTRYWIDNRTGQWKSSSMFVQNDPGGGEKPRVVCGDFYIVGFLEGTDDYVYYWNADGNWNSIGIVIPTSISYNFIVGDSYGNLFTCKNGDPAVRTGGILAPVSSEHFFCLI
jgi:hypothetical protein